MTVVVLRSGELDRRITIQSRSSAMDTSGQQLISWTDVATVWANIKPSSGRELIAAGAINAEVTHTIVIRYRPGITAAMRALYGSRIFDIAAVIEPETAHVSLELLCNEGINQG